MGLFGKGKDGLDRAVGMMAADNKPKASPVKTQEPLELRNSAGSFDIQELGQARTAIETFTAELRDSASKQQSAIKRISSLNTIISKMEIDLKSLRRVQSDNKALSKTVAELEAKLASKLSWAGELESKLNDIERRYSDTRNQLDEAHASLAASRDQEAAFQSQNSNHERTIRALTSKFQSAEDRINHNEGTIDKMQDRIDSQVAEIAQRERQTVELQNALEELNEKYTQKSVQGDSAIVELKNLRMEHSELKSRHVEATGQLENLKYDLQAQKNVHDDTVKRRDEENMALKTRIDQLDTQIRIKENMATHLDQEFISLRNALVNERDRAESLEQRLRQKSDEYERSAKALAKAKIEFEELNTKFAATLDDYETLRRVNSTQREKLERYASISGIAGGNLVLNTDILADDKATERAVDNSENVMKLNPKNPS